MKCYCVCHSEHASRAWCEHCQGDNEVGRFHARRLHWYWRWWQDLCRFGRDVRFIIRHRRLPATWKM